VNRTRAVLAAAFAACAALSLAVDRLAAQEQDGQVEKILQDGAREGEARGSEAGTDSVADSQEGQDAQEGQEPGTEAPELDLIRATLLRDIETASYYELVAWCRALGLGDSGARQVLQSRLIDFYRLEGLRRETAAGEGRILEIRSATETEYFTIEEIDEDYVILQGDVLVELREKDAVHRIRAERIVLNQSAGLLTAEGGIEYTLLKGEEEEVFRGEKLTFDIEDWSGVFFRGGIEAERPISGRNVRFRFEGQTISRLADDTVVMDRGTISSCEDREEPHYEVRARKIWILAPGEWAILNAVLYVGRIPIMYLPFYFHPGDEFFFHPSLGVREREGYFLQTTTYLVGQKKPQASALSFLAAAEESTVQYRKRIRGLFLRSVEGETIETREDRFLKILLDAYSRLGLFAGVSGSFPPYVSLQGGIGFSRNIYNQGGVYVPFKEVEGEFQSVWNQSWLFGSLVPFRYGLDASWSLSRSGYSLSGKFEHYSDPVFTTDFFARSEDIGLTRLAGLEEGTGILTVPTEKQALSWEVRTSADFSGISKTPLLKRLSVPTLNTSLLWQTREDTVSDWDAEDPARRFYYPVSLKAPTASVQVSGELLRLPGSLPKASGQASAPSSAPWTEDLRPPPAMRAAAASVPEPAEQPLPGVPSERPRPLALRPPRRREDLPSKVEKTPVSLTLSYQVRPNVNVEQTFDSADWKTAADVDGDVKLTSVDTSGTTSLDYNLRILEDLVVVGGSLLSSGSYRKSIDQGYDDPGGWAQLTLGDYRYSQFNLKNTFNATAYPLRGRGVFGSSSLSYALGWTIFRYTLEDSVQLYDLPVYTALGPEWTPGGVSQHSAKGALAWRAFNRDNSASLSVELPPRDMVLTAEAAFQLWLLRTTINTVLREPDEDNPTTPEDEFATTGWNAEIPVVIHEQLEITPEVRLTQELRIDAVPGVLTRSFSSLKLWGFSAAYTADRQDLGVSGWGPFEPALVSAGYRLAEQDLYLWKNRVQLQSSLSTSWSMNLRDYTRNSLDFTLSLKLFVHEFLEVSFTSVSYNNRTYRYFPGMAEELGVAWINPLEDLLRSFNFASEQDRLASAFKLKSINLNLIHHLHDWDLTLQYTGRPELTYRDDPTTPETDVKYRYEWNSSFSITLQWIPIPELRSTVRGDKLGEEDWDYTLRGNAGKSATPSAGLTLHSGCAYIQETGGL